MCRNRTRRVLEWVGLVGSVLLVVAWFLTLFWGGAYVGVTKTIGISKGAVGLLVHTPDPGDYVGWVGYRIADGLFNVDVRWWPTYDDSTSPASRAYPQQRVRRLFMPLWIPLLMIALPTVILWLADQRHPPGHCRKCGYDLTGNVTGVCSECGTKVSVS